MFKFFWCWLKIRITQVPDGFCFNSLVIKSSLSGGCSEKRDLQLLATLSYFYHGLKVFLWKNEFPKFCALLLLSNIVFASGCNNHDITISIIINNSYLKLWKATPWTIKHSIVINDILLLSQKNVSECVPSQMSLLILQMYTHIILLLNWSSAWAMMNLTCISFYF